MKLGLMLLLGLFLDRRLSSGSLRYSFLQVIMLISVRFAVVLLSLHTFHIFSDNFVFLLEQLELGFFLGKLTL